MTRKYDAGIAESTVRREQDTNPISSRGKFAYPDYEPLHDHARVLTRLAADSLWLRSVNLEYYYGYAVVEESATGRRFLIREPISTETWESLLIYLAKRGGE